MIRLFIVTAILLISGGFLVPTGVHAHDSAEHIVFFESLYDVPVMPGMKEVKDEAVLFDKPDGKIAIAVAVSDEITSSQVAGFYDEVLPQLGWSKLKQNQYVRDSEGLSLTLSEKEGLTYVRITLSPRAKAH